MLSRALFIARTRLAEAVKYSRVLRTLAGIIRVIRYEVARPAHKAEQLGLLCSAYEIIEHLQVSKWVADRIAQVIVEPGAMDWRHASGARRFEEMRKKGPSVDRCAVLKAPGPDGEKGLILATFEYNWFRLVADPAVFAELTREFNLVLSTSWSPAAYLPLALAVGQARDMVFVQPCNFGEIPKLEGFHPRVRCLQTLPSDWLHPDHYPPRPSAERDIDIVMVSNWAPFKRHWELFNALRDMPTNLRVVCIGQPDSGRTVDDIRVLQKRLGAPQEIEYLNRIPIQEVAELQSRAKIAIIMSRREGCCVAAAEGLMAGAALAMRYDAHVGTRDYVNEDTGVLLRPGSIAKQLKAMLARFETFHPRDYALQRVSCVTSSQKLNALVRDHELSRGRPWTQDLAMPTWRPHPTLVSEEDKKRLAPCYADLHRRWPTLFEADLIDTSWQ